MDIKEAIRKAGDNLPELFPDAEKSSIRLEGAELSENEQFWLVTYSFFEKPAAGEASATNRNMMDIRAYKTFRIKALDGEFMGFRNGFANAA